MNFLLWIITGLFLSGVKSAGSQEISRFDDFSPDSSVYFPVLFDNNLPIQQSRRVPQGPRTTTSRPSTTTTDRLPIAEHNYFEHIKQEATTVKSKYLTETYYTKEDDVTEPSVAREVQLPLRGENPVRAPHQLSYSPPPVATTTAAPLYRARPPPNLPPVDSTYYPPQPERYYQVTPKPDKYYQPPQTLEQDYQPPQKPEQLYRPPQNPVRPYQPPQNQAQLYQPPQESVQLYEPPQRLAQTLQPPQKPVRPYQPPQNKEQLYHLPERPQPYQPPQKPEQVYQPPEIPEQTYQPPQKLEQLHEPPQEPDQIYQPPQNPVQSYQTPQKPAQIYTTPQNPRQLYEAPQQPQKSYQPLQEPAQIYRAPQKEDRLYKPPRKPVIQRAQELEPHYQPPQKSDKQYQNTAVGQRQYQPIFESQRRFQEIKKPDRHYFSISVPEAVTLTAGIPIMSAGIRPYEDSHTVTYVEQHPTTRPRGRVIVRRPKPHRPGYIRRRPVGNGTLHEPQFVTDSVVPLQKLPEGYHTPYVAYIPRGRSIGAPLLTESILKLNPAPSLLSFKKERNLYIPRDYSPSSIPGEPGVDYPVFRSPPKTGFSCRSQQYPGIYTDTAAECQPFYMCQVDGREDAFICPNGTIFHQQYFVCDWWYNVNCDEAPSYYSLNSLLYQPEARKKYYGFNK